MTKKLITRILGGLVISPVLVLIYGVSTIITLTAYTITGKWYWHKVLSEFGIGKGGVKDE